MSAPSSREFRVDESESLLRKAERLVVAAFLTTWSRPCQLRDPVLLQIRTLYQAKVEVITVDADSNAELGVCSEVQSIPTLLYFFKGRLRARHGGSPASRPLFWSWNDCSEVSRDGSFQKSANPEAHPWGKTTNQALSKPNE